MPGITRRAVLSLAKEQGIKVEERAFSPSELYSAKEAFFTSATSIVMPVVQVDGMSVGDGIPGQLSKLLRETYLNMAIGKQEAY